MYKKYAWDGGYVPFRFHDRSRSEAVAFIHPETFNLAKGYFRGLEANSQLIAVRYNGDLLYVPAKDVISISRTRDVDFRMDYLQGQVPEDQVLQTLEESGLDDLVAIESSFGYYWIFEMV